MSSRFASADNVVEFRRTGASGPCRATLVAGFVRPTDRLRFLPLIVRC